MYISSTWLSLIDSFIWFETAAATCLAGWRQWQWWGRSGSLDRVELSADAAAAVVAAVNRTWCERSPGVMASHAELVSELASMDKMPMSDRLKLAKKRRAAQLKAYAQYEKQLNKNASRRGKKTVTTGSAVPACGSNSSSRARSQLRFSDSVLLLDATVRNDVDEGTASCLNYIPYELYLNKDVRAYAVSRVRCTYWHWTACQCFHWSCCAVQNIVHTCTAM